MSSLCIKILPFCSEEMHVYPCRSTAKLITSVCRYWVVTRNFASKSLSNDAKNYVWAEQDYKKPEKYCSDFVYFH